MLGVAIDSKTLPKALKFRRFGRTLFKPRRRPWTVMSNCIQKHIIMISGLTIFVMLVVISALGVSQTPQDLDSGATQQMPAYSLLADLL